MRMAAPITSNYTSGSGTLSFPPNTTLCEITQIIGGGGGGGGGYVNNTSPSSYGGSGGAQGGSFIASFAVSGGNFTYSIGGAGGAGENFFMNSGGQVGPDGVPASTAGGNTTFTYTNNSISITARGGGSGGMQGNPGGTGGTVTSSGTFINSTPSSGANGIINSGNSGGDGGGGFGAYGSGGNGGFASSSGFPGICGYLSLTFYTAFPAGSVSLTTVQNYYGPGLQSSVGRQIINSAGTITTIPITVSLSNFGGKAPVVTFVKTFAGSGSAAFADGIGTAASFYNPGQICIDSAGILYVADSGNNRIRRITTNGTVTTIAGSGTAGFADGIGAAASFSGPNGICIDSAGILYVADTFNQRIRRIATNGSVTTIAGSGSPAFADGIGAAASFWNPGSICIDSAGILYVADIINNRIRRITTNSSVDTFAGSGTEAFADGIGAAASFNNPWEICVDSTGVLYVSDFLNWKIRKITTNRTVTTIAGSGRGFADGTAMAAMFNFSKGICVDPAGILFVCDGNNNRIRRIGNYI